MVGSVKIMTLHCAHERSIWREEPPTSAHAYRVECVDCGGRFRKWGTEAEIKSLQRCGADVTVVRYEEPEAGPTLDEFFE